MAIPESQLQTWSNPGPVATAQATHESVRTALDRYAWPGGVNYNLYLQGSYRNATNIRGESDVDVVVQLDSTFHSDKSQLVPAEFARFQQTYPDATYLWTNFRADVLAALRNHFGGLRVTEGRKAIKVQTNYLTADVVPCALYRRYGTSLANSVEGMTFFVPSENRWVVNYPKVHYENGVAKHDATNQWYKATVRLFKNARTYMAERNQIADAIAPSYFVECLLYNVPNQQFGRTFDDTFVNVFNWINSATLSTFLCQNGQTALFGTTPEQWNEANAQQFMKALRNLWNNWS